MWIFKGVSSQVFGPLCVLQNAISYTFSYLLLNSEWKSLLTVKPIYIQFCTLGAVHSSSLAIDNYADLAAAQSLDAYGPKSLLVRLRLHGRYLYGDIEI